MCCFCGVRCIGGICSIRCLISINCIIDLDCLDISLCRNCNVHILIDGSYVRSVHRDRFDDVNLRTILDTPKSYLCFCNSVWIVFVVDVCCKRRSICFEIQSLLCRIRYRFFFIGGVINISQPNLCLCNLMGVLFIGNVSVYTSCESVQIRLKLSNILCFLFHPSTCLVSVICIVLIDWFLYCGFPNIIHNRAYQFICNILIDDEHGWIADHTHHLSLCGGFNHSIRKYSDFNSFLCHVLST